MIWEVFDLLDDYAKDLFETGKLGDATEESYYGDLESLLENYVNQKELESIHITALPKPTEAGNPDFRIWNTQREPVGYIEAKKPATTNLSKVAETDQLERYRNTFPNLILTNFFEFLLYREGELKSQVKISPPQVLSNSSGPPSVKNEARFFTLLDKFLTYSIPKTYTAESLAITLAKKTKFLRDDVLEKELEEKGEGSSKLHGFHEAFKKYFREGIDQEEFADLYAQTITYGLFAARTRAGEEFNRKLAYDKIPKTIGILSDIFKFLSLEEIPPQIEWIVDDISAIVATADVNNILETFYEEGKGTDPIVHFYETFLSEFDPKLRAQRGVFYTKEPIVTYITKSVNTILKKDFGKAQGLGSAGVNLLDPAAGTLTFIVKAAECAIQEFVKEYGSGGKSEFIEKHILENFYAFELMMAPYAIGHFKASFFLESEGFELSKNQRLNFYLTNTLEMGKLKEVPFPGMASLSEESKLASKVKQETPILAIIGNPPYHMHSSNMGEWIQEKLKNRYRINEDSKRQSYYEIDGEPLQEKNPKPLQDDYVKFIRFSQWKIDQSGEGVLGFITNHGYLDNATFGGMRQSLMKTFDKIFLLNLHGGRGEKSPDGTEDENVFDIRRGVVIGQFVKESVSSTREAKIYYHDIWGSREKKLDWLSENTIEDVDWEEVKPQSDQYLFVPRDEKLREVYKEWPQLTDILPVFSTGMVTSRDDFVIDSDRKVLEQRIRKFRDDNLSDEEVRELFSLSDNRDWKLDKRREKIVKDDEWEKKITKILYRPFDVRWIFYHQHAIDFGREEIMRHMTRENLGLISMRQVSLDEPYTHILITDSLIDNRTFTSSKGTAKLHPLYIYPHIGRDDLFESKNFQERKTNIPEHILGKLKRTYGSEITPKQVLFYVYAVLYSNDFREEYSQFFETKFPRVPFSGSYKIFSKLSQLGEELAMLHLLDFRNKGESVVRFQGEGSNEIAKPKRVGRNYKPDEERVYINKDHQYFEGITSELWEYQLGGYKVLDKWLKDRRERKLSLSEIKRYCKIATAIKKTIDKQKTIDEVYPEVEENTIDFNLGENK